MLKRLFNEYEAMNEAGSELSRKAEQALKPIINEYQDRGYSLRDIGEILTGEVGCMIGERVIVNGMELRRRNKAAKCL